MELLSKKTAACFIDHNAHHSQHLAYHIQQSRSALRWLLAPNETNVHQYSTAHNVYHQCNKLQQWT